MTAPVVVVAGADGDASGHDKKEEELTHLM